MPRLEIQVILVAESGCLKIFKVGRMENNSLKIIVTGGGNGIGSEIARSFAEKGAEVIIADKDDESGKSVRESINSSGGKSYFCHADISIPSDIIKLVSDSYRLLGRIDVLVNNAGYGVWKSPYDISVDEWDSIIDTNLRGTFLCSREAAAVMRKNGGGTIINISSTRALMSDENSEAYAASKGGIVALTHAMAASFSSDNIRVNCISPGWIETGDYEELREIDHTQHFSRRVGKPSDIAKACLFLAENDFINATNIIIDGGMTHKMIYAK
jgi:NAD(P)-dependent dehydrogenase (short-subunit alcohol dehydrogenase family)